MNLLPSLDQTLKRMLAETFLAEQEWLDQQMKAIMPEAIYECSKDETKLKRVAKWIKKNGVRQERGSMGELLLFHNGQLIAALRKG